MPEFLRALIVIMGIALPVFWLARQPLACALPDSLYLRTRNIWIGVTLIGFLVHNFWLYLALTAIVASQQKKHYGNPVVLYGALFFALPALEETIPGIGPIDHIIALNHYRLLNLVILVPLALQLYRTRAERPPAPRAINAFMLLLLAWMIITQARSDSITGTIRATFYFIVDLWVPYYAFSRSMRSIDDYRQLAGALVVSLVIIGLIGIFESARSWLLYEPLRAAWGLPEIFTRYLRRGDAGPLRAFATLGHAIVLGYVMTIGLGLALFLAPRMQPAWRRNIAIASLFGGLIASVSRGPWVGATAMLLVFFLSGPDLGKRLARLIGGGGFAFMLLLISPLGDRVISYLPFVGTVEPGSVEYRARLFDVSMEVFKQHPITGDFWFLRNPLLEQMRQGEGIIDIVNTYLQYALPYGSIGLFFFVAAFLSAFLMVNRTRKRLVDEPEQERLGRTLLGIVAGILVTIATVSTIGAISSLFWITIGLCASYVRLFQPGVQAVKMRRNAAPHARSAQSNRASALVR